MQYKLLMENWRKFVREEQARMDGGFGGQEVDPTPLSWDSILRECFSVWTADTLKKAMFESVRGLPSIIDLTLALTKDKDISVMLKLLKSDPETITLVYSDKTHSYSKKPDGSVVKGAATASADMETGQKVITYYMSGIDLGHLPLRTFRLFKAYQERRREGYQECLSRGYDPEDFQQSCYNGKALVDSRNLDNFG